MLSKTILRALFQQVNAVSYIEFRGFSPLCDEWRMIIIPVIFLTSLCTSRVVVLVLKFIRALSCQVITVSFKKRKSY